jgi:hypothetical protein
MATAMSVETCNQLIVPRSGKSKPYPLPAAKGGEAAINHRPARGKLDWNAWSASICRVRRAHAAQSAAIDRS